MDAHPGAIESGRLAAKDSLRILYAAPGNADVARARKLGFQHVLIPPPWPGQARRGQFLAMSFTPADARMRALADEAKSAGIDLLVDVQIDCLDAASPLTSEAASPFHAPDRSAMLDPRNTAKADVASARLGSAGDALALAAWWAPILKRWRQAGVAGFRLLGFATVPDDLAGVFFSALRQALPDTLLLVWTPGMRRAAVQGLSGLGVDGVFTSLPWWDFSASWFWDELAALMEVAPVIGAAGPAQDARALALAATIGQGFMYEGVGEEPARAVNAMRAAWPAFAARTMPRLLESGGPVWAFLRQDGADHRVSSTAALVSVNVDPDRPVSLPASALLPSCGGAFGPFRAMLPASGDMLRADSVILLKSGEFSVFAAEASARTAKIPPLDVSAAKQATKAPRLAIELPTPAVDGGAFPVKAIAGELVNVEADIVFDGHEMIAAALRWLAPGESGWQEVPMRPLGNDRWQAAFPLSDLGPHSYVVCAWRDRFGTFRG